MTGELLFFYFAWPCFEARLSSQKELLQYLPYLESCLSQKIGPDKKILEICFPEPIPEMERLCILNKIGKWEKENVQNYWCNHHLRRDDCNISRLTVNKLICNRMIVFTAEEQKLKFVNYYNLQLKEGDKVFTHKRCVILKEVDLS